MKKNRLISIVILYLLTVLLFFTAGCSGKTDDINVDNLNTETPNEIASDTPGKAPVNSPIYQSPFQTPSQASGKQTLTIAQWRDEIFGLEAAAKEFEKLHPGVEIIVQTSGGDLDKHILQLNTQLMAGGGPDIMEATGLRDIKKFESGYFADYYALMKSDPGFNEEDYYMNVFEGLAYRNKLFIFPTFFRYDIIGINNTIPEVLVNSYRQYDTITYRQMLDVYSGLPNNSGLYLDSNTDAILAINNSLMSFVDFENKTCNFNSDYFIELITDLKNTTNPQRAADGKLGEYKAVSLNLAEQEVYAQRYLFQTGDIVEFLFGAQIQIADSKLYPLFNPFAEKEVFTHFIPQTDDNSRIILRPFKSFYISEASKNKELAWEFIKFLTTPEANKDTKIYACPVHRELFKDRVPAKLTQYIDSWRNAAAFDESTGQVVERIMAQIERYNEMPMKYHAILSSEGGPAYVMLEETLLSFHNGILSAEQAASQLQNKMMLYLME
jgi:multiple sugar transport system substrate-binding protein